MAIDNIGIGNTITLATLPFPVRHSPFPTFMYFVV